MHLIKKIICCFITLFTLNLYIFHICMDGISLFGDIAHAAEKPPEFILSEEIEYSGSGIEGKDERGWFSRNKWWLALSVIIAAGAGAAAASGGGGDVDGGTGNENEGDYIVTW